MAKNRKKQAAQPQTKISPERYMREHVRKLPIDKCWISDEWQENGLAVVLITRKKKNGHFAVGSFLVDTFCLGVKDAGYWVDFDQEDLDNLLDRYAGMVTLKEATYAEAHNLILGAIEFAEEAGIEPHKDFAVAGYMLEEDTDDIPLIEYEYGKDGKYLLMVKFPDGKRNSLYPHSPGPSWR